MGLWKHQKEASVFAKNKEAVLLWHGMGCLGAHTRLELLKNGKQLNINIKTADTKWTIWQKENSVIEIESNIDNKIQYSEIENINFSGFKDCYKLNFTNNYFLICTEDHRIAVQAWKYDEFAYWVTSEHLKKTHSIYTVNRQSNIHLISKKYIGIIPTYDITMKHSNNFVANGIIVHNSGKSYTSIGIATDKKAQTILLGCPKSVLPTWESEFERHAPGQFDIFIAKKGSVAKKTKDVDKFLNKRTSLNLPKVVVINYESIWRPGFGHIYDKWKNIKDIGLIRKTHWDLIIADEIQKIKAPGSKVSLFFKLLKQNSTDRLGMSGTPFPNSPLDTYGVFRFLDSTIFGTSFQRFKMKYAEWGGFENRQVMRYINQAELNTNVYSISHRVETEDVIELPDYIDVPIYCELSKKAMTLYQEFKKEAVVQFQNGEELSVNNILVKYLRLAQMASGIIKDNQGKRHIIDTAKFDTIRDLILGINEPIVIFTRFTAEVNGIIDMIKKFKSRGEKERTVCRLVGGIDERELFKTGKADIIVVNIQAGGIGVNELVRARYGIYFSTGYGPGDYEQSRARIRRAGSDVNKKVFYYHIIAKGTIDVIIMRAIERKLNIIKTVLADFSRQVI